MLSILEVCQMTGKSEKTIYRMMNDQKLKYTQIDGKRFVEKNDVLALLPNRTEVEKRDALEQKISVLTNEVVRLSSLIESLIINQNTTDERDERLDCSTDKNQNHFKKQPKISSNEIRAKKAKNKLFEALNELQENESIPMYRNAPSVTGIHRLTGIDRGTISKYLKEWIDINK